jgi:hypothetical protein
MTSGKSTSMRIIFLAAVAALAAAALLASGPTMAQDKKPPAAAQPAPAAPLRLPVPPAENLVLLIRLSLLTLNDALQTGNYTVLRDRAGPSFQRGNTAAALSRVFAKLESQGVDLAGVAIMTPQLTTAEVGGVEQRLHVRGHFPGQPTQIEFDLMYEPSEGHWKLYGLSVAAVPVEAPVPVAQNPAAKAPAAKLAPPKAPTKK